MNIETIPQTDNQLDTTENFSQLFEEYIKEEKKEGQVVQGIIVGIDRDSIIVDVGLKSEGRIELSEFSVNGTKPVFSIGDKVDVYIEKFEGKGGRIILSREKAIRDGAWTKFETLCSQEVNIEGNIIGRVKGGFAVELGGIIAFLPGSQVDIRPIKDISALMGISQPFKILKVDKEHGNVVVSRRAILEESRKESRQELLSNIQEGGILEGTVKNITDYGVFVDLGFMDGLLHITDISWSKISHPSEILSLGQQIKVIITKYNPETQRVSLGLKQLEKNPWEELVEKYTVGKKVKGVINTVVDYGAFIEIEPGVEGLVYHTEMSWNAKNMHPRKLVKPGDEVEVIILEIDIAKHRISLSMKQCLENPWEKFAEKYPVGSKVTGIIKNIADFGMFVTITGDNPESSVDVLVPAAEISWNLPPEEAIKKYNKGEEINGTILSVDLERERVTVGIKQLMADDFSDTIGKLSKADAVTCTVVEVKKDGIEVELADGITSFIKKNDLSKHKEEQRPERFSSGDRVDAKILSYDKNNRQFQLSIRALEIEEEKKAIAEFGSSDSGASLGEILGAALKKDKGSSAQ